MNRRELAEALFLPVVGTIFALTAFQPIQDRMVAARTQAAPAAVSQEKEAAPAAHAPDSVSAPAAPAQVSQD
jgi:hypothetical protein